MPQFTNWKDLEKHLQQQIQDVMDKEVKQKAIDVIKKHSMTDFYDSYSPTRYHRNYDLLKDSTYDIKDFANGFSISSDFEVDGKNLVLIAQEGKELNMWDRYASDKHDLYSQYNRDSHFLTNSYEELNHGLVRDWIISGLRRRGIDAR